MHLLLMSGRCSWIILPTATAFCAICIWYLCRSSFWSRPGPPWQPADVAVAVAADRTGRPGATQRVCLPWEIPFQALKFALVTPCKNGSSSPLVNDMLAGDVRRISCRSERSYVLLTVSFTVPSANMLLFWI